MPRSLAEWYGANPDSPVPPRVRYRVFLNAERRCAHCRRKLRMGSRFTCDHVIALINGGENRERNLQIILCDWCNPQKNASDVAEKAKVYRSGSKQFAGFRETTGDPLPGTIASGWKRTMRRGWERRP